MHALRIHPVGRFEESQDGLYCWVSCYTEFTNEQLHSMSEIRLLSYFSVLVRTSALDYYLSVHVLLIFLQERGVIQCV